MEDTWTPGGQRHRQRQDLGMWRTEVEMGDSGGQRQDLRRWSSLRSGKTPPATTRDRKIVR